MIQYSIHINGRPDSLCIISQPYYYMLGDNRENSHDSRMYGYVPYSSVVGCMNFVIFSLNSDKDFIHAIRLGRFFKKNKLSHARERTYILIIEIRTIIAQSELRKMEGKSNVNVVLENFSKKLLHFILKYQKLLLSLPPKTDN